MAKYQHVDAPEVRELAEKIIAAHHPDLAEEGVRIDYLFVDPPPESKGMATWGRARVKSGLDAFLARGDGSATPFFVVEIAEKVWRTIDEKARVALLDHELCHCLVSYGEHGELKLTMRHHDMEEFVCIVERHGLWRQEVADMVEAALRNAKEGATA